jgi:hypothetical protein
MQRRSIIIAIINILILFCVFIDAQDMKSNGCDAIKSALVNINELRKPNKTRNDLKKSFQLNGGSYHRFECTYLYRECPFIKIDVKFKIDDVKGEDQFSKDWKLSDSDIIVEISKPFLEWPTID